MISAARSAQNGGEISRIIDLGAVRQLISGIQTQAGAINDMVDEMAKLIKLDD